MVILSPREIYIAPVYVSCMEPWFVVTQLGLPEGWAAISLGMVMTYIILRHTSWTKPSPERAAFKRAAVLLTFTLILSFVVVHGIKEVTQVPRPCTPCASPELSELPGLPQDNLAGKESVCNPYCIAGDPSFPSGHATTIFAVCTVAVLLLRRREALLLYLPAAVIAYSRIVLGVHTLPDIAAGSLIGLFSALVIWRIHPRMGIFASK
jgi:undecaprenyl-diphosphatase